MMALKKLLFALSCWSSTVVVAQEITQVVPSVLQPPGIYVEAVAPTPRRLSVVMGTAALRIAVADWCADPTTAEADHGHISEWDVSGVTDMSNLIPTYCGMGKHFTFNEDLSGWDVSAVTNMYSMFSHASSFNQPLSAWDVSAVTDMRYMFHKAPAFNQPLSAWDVSAVTDMRAMFFRAPAFNQPLSGWDVSHVIYMNHMFYGATSFNYVLCWVVTGTSQFMFSGSQGSANGECTKCVANEFRVVGTTTCAACAAGSFSSPTAGSSGADSCSAGPVGTCFHGATQVTLEDKSTKAMTELQVGDKIQTADIHGNLDFAPIISLPHKAGNSEMATFLKIVTDSGKSVQMTPGHLIPNCAGKMFSANEVALGDCVMTVDGKEAVSIITSATHFGVYTAVTAHALIVANSIIASPFSVENDPHHHKDNDGISSPFIYFLNKMSGKVSTGLRGAKEPSNS